MKLWLSKIVELLGWGKPKPTPVDRSSLLSMYLSHSNSAAPLLMRHRGTQQRENGKYAQTRNRN